jgi:hypothetical protein
MGDELMGAATTMSRARLVRLLRRVGYQPEVIEEISAQVGDPVDFGRDSQILARDGVTAERLTDLMGASP